MKELIESWKQSLEEAAKDLSSLSSDDFYIEIEDLWGSTTDIEGFQIHLLDANSQEEGFSMAHLEFGSSQYRQYCEDALVIYWVNTKGDSRAEGYGPLLYDIAMEWAAKNNHWLMPDRDNISSNAFRVWEYYMNKRPDVKSKPLSETCPSPEEYEVKFQNREDNPLNYMYTKEIEILPKLERMGKLRLTGN